MNNGLGYDQFYKVLLNLREAFHSSGRFDDSNAKLDEIVKLLCIAYARAANGETFTLLDLRARASEESGDTTMTAKALRSMFAETAKSELFLNSDGTSIFGANPALSIQESENAFAEEVVSELSRIDFLTLVNDESEESFDILNECFGHFVRENFRNNKEDAQYMTPLEIAHPYIQTVFKEMRRDGYFDSLRDLDFRVMDPTCGVGTLLLEAARAYIAELSELPADEKDQIVASFLDHGIIGQDKVDRMVRLSKINAILYGANGAHITCGNSILGESDIDRYRGKVDLIFTNPPFGAEFALSTLPPALRSSIRVDGLTGTRFNSEVLMLYRCLDMLKDGGYLAIVLPDSVISSKGNNAKVRKGLLERWDVQSVVELPAVTFAQAGTRTKTALLLVRKSVPSGDSILMCTCNSVGFSVRERSGVPVKTKLPDNDVASFADLYPESREGILDAIVSREPSITAVLPDELINQALTPSFYSAERLSTYKALSECSNKDFEFRPLGSVAKFATKKRKKKPTGNGVHHISVLHIRSDSTIDKQEVLAFEPISDGRSCHTNDLIFSKINPNIPRMAVVPDFGFEAVCSMEFEILEVDCDVLGPNCLCLILKSDIVQAQIRNLTSGTSSSHNRIKTEQLEEILVPVPISDSGRQRYEDLENRIAAAFKSKYDSDDILQESLTAFQAIV